MDSIWFVLGNVANFSFSDALSSSILYRSQDKCREWGQALAERQAEIKSAKNGAAERVKAETMAKMLESRGVLARLLNQRPSMV